jgi:hypothetical protein
MSEAKLTCPKCKQQTLDMSKGWGWISVGCPCGYADTALTED